MFMGAITMPPELDNKTPFKFTIPLINYPNANEKNPIKNDRVLDFNA